MEEYFFVDFSNFQTISQSVLRDKFLRNKDVTQSDIRYSFLFFPSLVE